MAEVTVVIPSYNHEEYIEATIQSVLGQDFTDIEVIIVDDFSLDDSISTIMKFNDPRIRLIRLEKNVGGAEALNVGISNSNSKFIAICNSDDVWEKGKLQAQIELMHTAPQIAAVFTAVKWIDGDGNGLENYSNSILNGLFQKSNRSRSAWMQELVNNMNCLCHSSVLLRSEVLRSLGPYNNMLRQLPDYEMWLRIVEQHPIFVLSEEYVQFRKHAHNASRGDEINKLRTRREYTTIMQEFFFRMDSKTFLNSFGFGNYDTDGGLVDRIQFLLTAEGKLAPELRAAGAALAYRAVSQDPTLIKAFDHMVIHAATVGLANSITSGLPTSPVFSDAEAANAEGCRAFAQNRYAYAMTCFEIALEISPELWIARENLSVVSAATGDEREVLRLARNHLEKMTPAAQKVAFRASVNTMDMRLAEKILERLRRSEPAAVLLQYKARLSQMQSDYEVALYQAADAVWAAPNSREARHLFVEMLTKFVFALGQNTLREWLESVGIGPSETRRCSGGGQTVDLVFRQYGPTEKWGGQKANFLEASMRGNGQLSVMIDERDFYKQSSLVDRVDVCFRPAKSGWLNTFAETSNAEYIAVFASDQSLPNQWFSRLINCLAEDTTCILAAPALLGIAVQSPLMKVTADSALYEHEASKCDLYRIKHAGSVSHLPVLPNALCGVIHRQTFLDLGGVRPELFQSETAQLADFALRGLMAGHSVRLDSTTIGKFLGSNINEQDDLLIGLVAHHPPLAVLLAQFGTVVDPALQLLRARHTRT